VKPSDGHKSRRCRESHPSPGSITVIPAKRSASRNPERFWRQRLPFH
jgi:hypothetical protein